VQIQLRAQLFQAPIQAGEQSSDKVGAPSSRLDTSAWATSQN